MLAKTSAAVDPLLRIMGAPIYISTFFAYFFVRTRAIELAERSPLYHVRSDKEMFVCNSH